MNHPIKCIYSLPSWWNICFKTNVIIRKLLQFALTFVYFGLLQRKKFESWGNPCPRYLFLPYLVFLLYFRVRYMWTALWWNFPYFTMSNALWCHFLCICIAVHVWGLFHALERGEQPHQEHTGVTIIHTRINILSILQRIPHCKKYWFQGLKPEFMLDTNWSERF